MFSVASSGQQWSRATYLMIVVVLCGTVSGQDRSGMPLNRYLPPLNYAPPFPPRPPLRPPLRASSSPLQHHQQGPSGSATSATAVSGAFGRGASTVTPIPILRQTYTNEGQGNYNFVFETGNGIKRDESSIYQGPWPNGKILIRGSYSYTGDDGKIYSVTYTADSRGFHAQGSHLPSSSPHKDTHRPLQHRGGARSSSTGHAFRGSGGHQRHSSGPQTSLSSGHPLPPPSSLPSSSVLSTPALSSSRGGVSDYLPPSGQRQAGYYYAPPPPLPLRR